MKNIHTCCLKRNTDQHIIKLTQPQRTIELTNVTSADRPSRNAQTRVRGTVQEATIKLGSFRGTKETSWATQTDSCIQSPAVRNNALALGRKLLRTEKLLQQFEQKLRRKNVQTKSTKIDIFRDSICGI